MQRFFVYDPERHFCGPCVEDLAAGARESPAQVPGSRGTRAQTQQFDKEQRVLRAYVG